MSSGFPFGLLGSAACLHAGRKMDVPQSSPEHCKTRSYGISLLQNNNQIVFQEYKLLADSRLTERVKLWSYMQKPLDHEAVKINFLRKVHRKNPPFRRKEVFPGRLRLRVFLQSSSNQWLYLLNLKTFRYLKSSRINISILLCSLFD